MAQTTAGTVELTVSGASAVAAIEIVAAGAVIGTLVVAAAAHNNPKSQESLVKGDILVYCIIDI